MNTPPDIPPDRTAPLTRPPVIPEIEDHDPGAMDHIMPTRNVPALLSWYLGVFGLIPVLGIPMALAAIVTGILGLRAARRRDVKVGKGHAIAGLILGILMGVLLPVGIFVAFALSNAGYF